MGRSSTPAVTSPGSSTPRRQEAVVVGKPSAAYFDAACEALDAEPGMTWMVGDDLETDIVGARGVGMRTVLVRTGKFRPDALDALARAARRDRLVDRARARLDRGSRLMSRQRRHRPDRDRADPSLARAARERFRERCFTEAERAYCDSRPNPAESYAGRFAGKEAVGKALGFGVARAFAWKEIEIVGRPKPAVRLCRAARGARGRDRRRCGRPLDDALARARAGGGCCIRRRLGTHFETNHGSPAALVGAILRPQSRK